MKPVHVNPHHVKKSKELDDNNPSKNDRKDPKTIDQRRLAESGCCKWTDNHKTGTTAL